MKRTLYIVCSVLVASFLWSCGNGNNWEINGSVEGSDSTTLYLEGPAQNGWYVMDSTILAGDGDFEFVQPNMGYPEIYRLKANGKVVYFPIDSLETITFKGYASSLDSNYTLEGSVSAEMMMNIDKKIAAVVAKGGEQAAGTDSILKRELSEMVLGDNHGLISYYIINKRVGNTRIFDPNNKKDIRIIGAVANKFTSQRPTDHRTELLKQLFIENRRVSKVGDGDTIQVAQTSLFDIKLYDNKGVLHSLKDVASKGKVTLLNFTVYGTEQSPAFNIALNKVYEANKNKMEIFQVAVDDNEAVWKESAENLPWITVYASQLERAKPLSSYNVTLLPMTFIIDKNGELAERVDDVSKLETALKKYF